MRRLRTLQTTGTVRLLLAATLLMASPAGAATYSVLHSFGILTNITGINPQAPLVQGPDGTLYGTTYNGEGSVAGTVFKIQPAGTGFAVLKYFTNGVEGGSPYGGLVLSGTKLYGTTEQGGSNGIGTVFALDTSGTGFTNLHSFNGDDGYGPDCTLALAGGQLYGTTESGGDSSYGTIFRINPDGSGFTNLFQFGDTNGASPYGALAVGGGFIYGTTSSGGVVEEGIVFRLATNGSGFTNLHEFALLHGSYDPEDGEEPMAGLLLSGATLFGTTSNGGTNGYGTVFRLNTDGTQYAIVHDFNDIDGEEPAGELILSGNTLFGTATSGTQSGVVFSVLTNGNSFADLHQFSGSDGESPNAGLVLSNGTLFGTTYAGGSVNAGTVFKISATGSGFVHLFDFHYSGDGASPSSGLVLSGGTLYGTTLAGGPLADGTVFRVNTDGSGYAIMHSFSGGDGSQPIGDLVLSGSTLYGTALSGGSNNDGTIFRISTNGTGFTNFYQFTYDYLNHPNDGAAPLGRLLLVNDVLYGVTSAGGADDEGTFFRINTNGTGYTNFFHFSSASRPPNAGLVALGNSLYGTTAQSIFRVDTNGTGYTNLLSLGAIDGVLPEGVEAGLTLSASTLYGTSLSGGSDSYGEVFRLSTGGSSFTNLHNFSRPTPFNSTSNSDGLAPTAPVILAGGTLYGVASGGGSAGKGTVFQLQTDGSGFVALHSFNSADGAGPRDSLLFSNGTLYGTASAGGGLGDGVIFALNLAASPLLTIQAAGTAVVLQWSASGFTLQSAPAATGPYTNLTGAASPYTNSVSSKQQFFRLQGN
jgi:uncharacterized repeat protein (TIGR03803 family)